MAPEEMPSPDDSQRLWPGGPIERRRRRRPPVDHKWLELVVGHAGPPDDKALPEPEIDATEAQGTRPGT
ncbi:MAG: hypothetical protein NVS3B21_04660 [Acidimicrobiales bacterium]